jgi:hypothetical protein
LHDSLMPAGRLQPVDDLLHVQRAVAMHGSKPPPICAKAGSTRRRGLP